MVRHPGYLALFLQVTGAPLVLGSLWALAPAALVGLLLVARSFMEDRALQRELKGYAAYCRQVPTLMLPGLW